MSDQSNERPISGLIRNLVLAALEVGDYAKAQSITAPTFPRVRD
jgi:hypothetical protein